MNLVVARMKVQSKPPADVPQGCVVEFAKVRLYAASSGSEGSKLEAVRPASAWQEVQVTWGNQAETLGAAATTWAGEGYIPWNVTAQVQGTYSGGNHGFLIRDASEDGGGIEQGFRSREKSTDRPPELVITLPSTKGPRRVTARRQASITGSLRVPRSVPKKHQARALKNRSGPGVVVSPGGPTSAPFRRRRVRERPERIFE